MTAEIDPPEVVEQMRDATDRLREQGWMVAPLTKDAPLLEADSVETPADA